MTAFDHYDPDALAFLSDLRANNSRAWFTEQKARYEQRIKAPSQDFAAQMAMALEAVSGHSIKSKMFRIHRDVRFSKDKTPYNAHVHLSFAPDGLGDAPPMWFFGLSPERLTLGCGVFEYGKAALDRFRAAMAGPKGADLIDLGHRLEAAGLRVSEPQLKRVPAGYDKDHPHGEALRRKGFSVWRDMAPAFVTAPGLVSRSMEAMTPLRPVFDLLCEIPDPESARGSNSG
ncbi:MAG: DUF2461 domain-containing protein [Pseudomonadota bacterium]